MRLDEFYNDDEFIRAEDELVYRSAFNRISVNKEASRHLREGFGRRIFMMQCSRIFLREHTNREGNDPPDPYLVEELNVHMNSYYINLRGCLDNLAWALNYQFSIVSANEDAPNRKDCDLFGGRFLRSLEQLQPSLRDCLRPYENWASDLKHLRDPAAHRVPMSVIGGFLTPERVAEFDTLWSKASLHDRERNGYSRSHFVRQAYRLLEYAPLLAVSTVSGLETREISVQVGNDHRQFLTLAGLVVDAFSNAAS